MVSLVTIFALRSLRSPKTTVFACALIGISVLYGSKNWPFTTDDGPLDHAGFFYDLLWRLNEDRQMVGWEPLVKDVQLQEWAREQIRDAEKDSWLSTSQVLQQLKEDVPSVATASIFVAHSSRQEDLQERIAAWAMNVDAEQKHLAANIFRDFDGEGYGGLVLMVTRLPKFHPKFLSKKHAQSFYNVCPLCEESHHGKVTSGARSIVLECPRCNQKYDLLALDLRGDYHRVTDFLVGEAPPANSVPKAGAKRGRLQELFSIWEKLLGYCRYAKDFQRISGQRDAWQFADETDRYRSGDCEDTAILLADWLISCCES